MLLEHLIVNDPQFQTLEAATPAELLTAQINTVDWHETDVADDAAKTLARKAFTAFTSPDAPLEVTQASILQLRAPSAVQHLVGMLSAYDWDFIEQAKELRGYVVAKLLEESKGPRATDRLRAVQLLGNLTEVASFTERSEVTIKKEDSAEIEERLRARLKSLLPPQQPPQDAEVKEIAVVKHEAPEAAPPL